MDNLTEKVKCLISNQKEMEAENNVHIMALREEKTSWNEQRNKLLTPRLKLVSIWLNLLSADQEYVVRRHLVDGLSWSALTAEYSKLWPEFPKCERTLIRIHKRALRKIANFTKQNIDALSQYLD